MTHRVTSKTEFTQLIKTIEAKDTYKKPKAFGLGLRRHKAGQTLDVHYLCPNVNKNFGTAAIITDQLNITESGTTSVTFADLAEIFEAFRPFHDELEAHANVAAIHQLVHFKAEPDTYAEFDVVACVLFDFDQPVQSAQEAYFKLQLLSHRLVKPHDVCLDGAFGKLTNVAWTNKGPILPGDVPAQRVKWLGTNSPLDVSHVDKFPYLVNYHIPSGTRIASGSQVRLGAYLGAGTTIMPAGYVNFNAGTMGQAMIEGRVSAGVVVGDKSDVGGGASIMGTLSGGNDRVISIADQCLLGANAGTGISLGTGCTIEAGLYITAAKKVFLQNAKGEPVDIDGNVVADGENIVKAAELSGKTHLLFIQDSRTGHVICKPNAKTIALNEQLHHN